MNPRVLRAAPAALLVLVGLVALTGCARQPSAREIKAWDAELALLQAEQDSLRAQILSLVKADPRVQSLPKGDIVLSIPTSFVRSVIEKVFDEVANHVTLRMGGFKARVEKKVKKIVTVGEFVVNVDVDEVVGRLRPRRPNITFTNNRIGLSLPVEVADGHGNATIHFVWNGKNIADVTCGDMDITQKVAGDVVPARYVVSGTMALRVDGNHLVATPRFPLTKVRIRITPTKESWKAIDAILAEKHGVCGWVLDKVDVPTLLKNLVQEKGINIRLPVDKIKPFAIPAGISDSVTVKGRVVAVATSDPTIKVSPEAILYSAQVSLR